MQEKKHRLKTNFRMYIIACFFVVGMYAPQVLAIPFTYQVSTKTPLDGAIPANGCPNTGVSATFVVTDNFTITDVDVGLNMSHTWRGDITVQLTAPNTATTTIFTDNANNGADNLNVLFDSASLNTIPAGTHALSPEYFNVGQPVPALALNGFNGVSSAGTWTLFVCDVVVADTGIFNNAELRLNGNPIVVATQINGVLYKELNNDGIKDFNEIGVPGATVTAYDTTGAIAGTTTTGATGSYSLAGLVDGVEYRIEFTNIPNNYQPSINGLNSMTSVVFVTSPSSTVFYGVGSTSQFCQADPTVVTNLYRPLGQTTNSALLSFPYSSTGTAAAGVEANYSQLGSTWGLAYQSESNILFASSFLKRHVQFGPGGGGAGDLTGSIYSIDNPTDALLSTVTEFLNLNDIVGANVTGVNPHTTTASLTLDATSFVQAGKTSFGDIDISDDSKDLWVVNLFNRNLYRLPLGNNPTIPTVPILAEISAIDMLNTANYVAGSAPACAGGNANNFRPFALKFHLGKVFVGAVCSAETGGIGLDAHIYALDLNTSLFTQVLTFPLNFNRGCGLSGNGNCLGGAGNNTANWNAWASTYPPVGMVSIGSERAYPQPIISDIEFTNEEFMIIGFRDRWGDQMGHNQLAPDNSGLIKGEGYGDIVRALPNAGATAWTFNAVEATEGTEYFNADSWTDGTFTHNETGFGGLLSSPAFSTVTMTNMDPINLGGGQSDFAGGVRSYKTTPGAVDHSYQIYTDVNGDNSGTTFFGKSNGLGDLEALCATPNQEIGSRIWNDGNANGVQDAGEAGISGLTVQLIDTDGITVLATVVTDASGQFYFSNAPGVDVLGKNFGVALLSDISNYKFSVDMTQVALTNLQVTARGGTSGSFASNDIHDSDAVLNGTLAEITVATGASGASNHSYDFGFFLPKATIGNRVWLDLDGNGIQNANEEGIANRIIQLTPPAGIDVGAGLGVAITTVTDTAGNYIFPNLPIANGYVVTVTNPPIGLTQTFDENGIVTPDTTTVNLTVANEEHLTADFGYAPAPGSIGDYVWSDVNGDGVQDPGEVGLAGLTVYLCTAAASSPCNATSTGVVTTTTDATGRYLFTGVNLTQVSVVQVDTTTLPAGYNLTGDPDAVADSQTTVPALNTSNNINLDADFGYQPTIAANNSNIGDTIYLDLNGNGAQDAGETGIPGVTVQLFIDTTLNGVADTPIASVFTDATGQYLFPSLLNGATYGVHVTDTNNILNGLKQTGDPDATLDNQSTIPNLLVDNLLQDFGYVSVKNGTGVIGDKIFLDVNANNLQDAADQGLEGVKISLFNNADGLIDSVVYTDENGQYLFTGLNPTATYTVVVDTTTLPNGGAGWNNNIDPDATLDAQSIVDLSLAVNGIDLNQDFGFVAAVSNTISGTVWSDNDGNGLLTDGTGIPSTPVETANGINLVTIVLLDTNGNIVATTTTDAMGNYSFPGLPNGSYTVMVSDTNNVLANLIHTDGPNANNNAIDNNSQNDMGYVVAVTGGVINTTADFGYRPVVTTPVTLASFKAMYNPKSGQTIISWSTITESGNVGFNLFTRLSGTWTQINDALVVSKNIYHVGTTQYQYVYEGKQTQEWMIVDVDIKGKRQTHGIYQTNHLYGENLAKKKSTKWNAINKTHLLQLKKRDNKKAKAINTYINKMKNKVNINDGETP